MTVVKSQYDCNQGQIPPCLFARSVIVKQTMPCETENVKCITRLDAKSIALAEIIQYLEEARANDILPPVLNLAELGQK